VASCPSCGEENPERAKFCLECGAALTEAVTPEPFRKTVTIVFSDVVGSTALGERFDPETLSDLLTEYFDAVRPVVERHGGTVAKFIGDAVMAVFGIPQVHEDDALRGVRAAVEMRETLAALNPTLQRRYGVTLSTRTGINTGPVVGKGVMPDRNFVSGDTANTAARLQTGADADEILLGESTYRLVRHQIEAELLPPFSAKGKEAPLTVYRLVTALSETDVIAKRLRESKAPLVGRELERPLLIGMFERAAQQRSVQHVTLVGEPGVGKSRLIAELFAHIDAKPDPARWLQGRCLPYGEGITFWALGEIVKAEAAILESDSAEVAAAKLNAAVAPEEPERQWLLQRLAPLVGVEAPSAAERQELFTAWRHFLEGLAAGRPSVLVFEDLHWADDALLAFLEHLAEWSHGVPLLVLCAARPELYERKPSWGTGQRNAHTINLSPLSDQETTELVSHLVSKNVLGRELERAVLERAGGNPLYAEEFVRLLADRGLEQPGDRLSEAAVPDSVQALIAARLDTLSPELKSLLQDAAVLGKVFWVGALAEIGSCERREVELALHELARKELVRPQRSSSMTDDSEYSFWHLLVRDVAYGQIPRADRARRHRAAAAWIESQAGDRAEDVAEVLAHHYLEALELAEAAGATEDAAKAAGPARRFLALAGERALGLDTAQAESRLARALELTPLEDPERPELLVRWADAAQQAGRLREAAKALDEALTSLSARGETETAARALQLRSRIALVSGEAQHVAHAAKAVALLERETPSPALVAAYAQLTNAHAIAGAYSETIAAANRACALAETLGLPEPARAVGYRGFARAYLGDADGLAEMEKALPLLVERGAGRDAASLQNNLALARYPLQGPAESLAAFEQGIAFCEQRGLAQARLHLETSCPGLLAELGRTEEALERASRLAIAAEASGATLLLIELRSVELTSHLARGEQGAPENADWLVEAARASGAADMVVLGLVAAALASEAPERACALLAEVEQAAGTRETTYYARQLAVMVRTALAAGDLPLAQRLAEGLERRYPLDEHSLCAARAQFEEYSADHVAAAILYSEAAARWQEFGNVPERAHALLGRGRCLHTHSPLEAEQALRQARDLFAAMDYKPTLAEIDTLLQQMPAPATS
jgi:class 3 adenylate cyclase